MTHAAGAPVAERAMAAQSAQPQARATGAKAKVFGSRDDLLKGRTLKTKEVEVEGKTYIVRELMQDEIEEIAAHIDEEIQLPPVEVTLPDGTKEKRPGGFEKRTNSRGFKARTVTFALVDSNLDPLFGNPSQEWEDVNKRLTPDVMNALFEAVQSFSSSAEARKELGKDSAKAAS